MNGIVDSNKPTPIGMARGGDYEMTAINNGRLNDDNDGEQRVEHNKRSFFHDLEVESSLEPSQHGDDSD